MNVKLERLLKVLCYAQNATHSGIKRSLMSPINFSLYEDLPEPDILRKQRKEAEEKEEAQKKADDVCKNCICENNSQ